VYKTVWKELLPAMVKRGGHCSDPDRLRLEKNRVMRRGGGINPHLGIGEGRSKRFLQGKQRGAKKHRNTSAEKS